MPENSIQDKVLQAIKTGEVKAKSKWFFYAQSLLMALGVLICALLLLFFASLIIFSLRSSGALFAPGFGFYGLRVFFASLPWLILVAVILLLILLEWMLRRYKFAYQKPLLYTFVGLGMVFIVGSLIISRAHIHEELFEQARMRHIIVGEPFYRRYGMPGRGEVTRGTVIQKNADGCDIETKDNETVHVIITPQTKLDGTDFCDLDKLIMVLGPRDDGSIQAFGIKKISGDTNYFYMRIPPPNFPSPRQ